MSVPILEFIEAVRASFVGADHVYTNGSCYQFFKILKVVYPDAIAYYDNDHIISKIGNKYYDITGEVEKGKHTTLDGYNSDTSIKTAKWSMYSNVLYCEDCDSCSPLIK